MSIASRITSIEGHISDIYDSVELTGVDTTDIDKNLVNVPNTLKEGYIDIINNGTDTLYNNFPKVSGEGTSLTLNNTYQAPMRNNLKGNTSQTGTPTPTSPIPVNVVSGDNEIVVNGKNLWGGFTQYSNSNNGVSFTVNENGSYYANGTATATASLTVNNLKTNNIYKSLQAGTYTMSKTSNKVQLQAYDVDTTTLLLNITTSNTSGSFTLTNTTNVALRISVPNGTSVNDTFTIMLEKGSSASTYEPYIGNTYNINLNGNLFKKENLLMGYYVDTDGSLVSASSSNVADFIEVTPNASYTLSYTYTTLSSTNTRRIGFYDSSKNFISATIYTPTNTSINITTPNNTAYIRFTLDKNVSDVTFIPDSFTPIELCKIGNYQDYIYKDSDKWYLHKEIKKVVLNGTYVNSRGTTGTNAYYLSTSIVTLNDNTKALVICDMFNSVSFNNRADGNYNTYSQNGFINLRTGNNTTLDWSTLDKAKEWANSNSPIVYYVLETPTTTEITDTTLINQLEELYIAKSKENQTNISQINNDLGFIISASALKKGV